MKKMNVLSALAAAALVVSAGSAFAQVRPPGTLSVKLNVTTGCDINGGGGIGAGTGQASVLDFGSHAVAASGVTAVTPGSGTTALVVTCSGTQTPSLAFDAGLNAVGSVRNMKTASTTATVQTIPYTLGSTAAATEYGPNTVVAQSAYAAGVPQAVLVHGAVTGAIPTGAEGQYTDTVTVALTW